MSVCDFNQTSSFSLEGKFLGFVRKCGGELKYLRIAVETNEFQIKLPKELRSTLSQVLESGDWIQVIGKKKHKPLKAEVKLKADRVKKLSEHGVSPDSPVIEVLTKMPSPSSVSLSSPRKPKILVCQKSGCLKRGSKKLCQQLHTALCDRGLQNQVIIEPTGCLKHCSSAPNMVLMPGKTRCSKMHPNAIADLLAKHLIPALQPSCETLSTHQN